MYQVEVLPTINATAVRIGISAVIGAKNVPGTINRYSLERFDPGTFAGGRPGGPPRWSVSRARA